MPECTKNFVEICKQKLNDKKYAGSFLTDLSEPFDCLRTWPT